MDFSVWTGPVGLLSAGLAVFFGMIWHQGRQLRKPISSAPCSSGEDRETFCWEEMAAALDARQEAVAALLDRASDTTRHLERMIETFERTFYSDRNISPSAPNPSLQESSPSVEAVFDSLRGEMQNQTAALGTDVAQLTRTLRRDSSSPRVGKKSTAERVLQ